MEPLILTDPIPDSKLILEKKERQSARMTLIGCSILVFVTSVCIMVLELTASRLIAQKVGSSLYTWTSVIGVILAGISAGNFLGGWLADRYDHRKLLGWLFLISSACCVTIYPLMQLIAPIRPNWISWPMWVVTVVSVLFFHPSLALGTITPVTVSLALGKSLKTGATVGNVYAWGAMGSILGTFLAGFFLISSLGTQNIIWLTAATLALMGICVASGQLMFRGVMLFGWLQFVLWIGLLASAKQPELEAGEKPQWWQKALGKAHELGIELQLRSDDPHEYHVESNYYSIRVGQRMPGNDPRVMVPALILDQLAHSYVNLDDPTHFYYDYERVYAALTERASEHWNRQVEVKLDALPKGASQLPERVTFDAQAKKLIAQGAINQQQFDALLALSPQAEYWKAIQNLTSLENMSLYSSMSSVPLEQLPPGLTMPQNLAAKINFDPNLASITRYEKLTSKERDLLMSLGPDKDLYTAAASLHERSRQTKTLFVGGGGYVFPRWIEANFPYKPVIHVLELDPAVKLAVQKEMGLPPDDATPIKSILGDARNSVDDLLNGLEHDPQSPGKHNHYDFVYGDAYNDLSIPWHLTTKEFTEKIKELLTPEEGLFMANIIEIYPRAQVPRKLTVAERIDESKKKLGMNFVPPAMIPDDMPSDTWVYAKAPFDNFEIYLLNEEESSKPGEKQYILGCRNAINDEVQALLLELAPRNANWQRAVADLTERSKSFNTGRFLGAYVNTACQVFPNVYVFSTSQSTPTNQAIPTDERDTYVVVCALKKLDLKDLKQSGDHWSAAPFAWMESNSEGDRVNSRQMTTILEHARGVTLTDDFAPVDNLLVPVFSRQDD